MVGRSREGVLDRIIYVRPATYGELPLNQRYELARVVGKLCHADGGKRILLVGPGRWGTTTPALGVPVSFRDISPVVALCEIVAMREDLVPDVSLGTHFFSDLIERDILYVGLFPGREGNCIAQDYFEDSPNQLLRLLPGAGRWQDVIRVIDAEQSTRQGRLRLSADPLQQRFVCHTDG